MKKGELVCCDLLDFEPVQGATFVRGDFREQDVRDMVRVRERESVCVC